MAAFLGDIYLCSFGGAGSLIKRADGPAQICDVDEKAVAHSGGEEETLLIFRTDFFSKYSHGQLLPCQYKCGKAQTAEPRPFLLG